MQETNPQINTAGLDPDKKITLSREEEMQALKEVILSQKICSHLAETARGLVMGAGSLEAKILFVGEAPGKKEDEMGLPFVGASGKLLNELLASIALVRADVYITNIVKYRPPDNRDPSPSEKAEFRPFLIRQIEIIKPIVVVTLGRHAMEEFLPDASIGKIHGTSQKDAAGQIVVPLYHPAAALYNGSLRDTLFEDFRKLKSQIEA